MFQFQEINTVEPLLRCYSQHKCIEFYPGQKRDHPSRKATFLVQMGWPHKRGSTVSITKISYIGTPLVRSPYSHQKCGLVLSNQYIYR